MELWRLLLFNVLCVLLQGCLLYKSQNIDCQLKYKCNGKIQKDDFGLPKIEILYYEVLVVICLPLFYLFKLLFKRQHFRIVLILTTILYLIINAIILIFICTFIFSLYQIQVKEKQYNKNKCKLVQNCQEGNLFYILQMIMFSAWQIIFTYIYLQQNGKYRPMIELFRRFGLLFRIILVNISILWFLWDNFNVYLVLEKILLCSEYCFSRDEKYMAYVILAQFINLNLILIYTLVLQIEEIFTTIGHERRKNKWLNFIIIYTQISFLLFGVTFNTVIQLFSSYLLFLFYLYLFIQLNSYQSLYVKQESNKYYIQTNVIHCKKCKDYITQNDQIVYSGDSTDIVYFSDSTNIFHKQCLIQQELIEQSLLSYHIDLYKFCQPKQSQNQYFIFILYLINWIYLSNLLQANDDTELDKNCLYIIYIQFTIIYLLVLMQNLKYFKTYFCLYLIIFLTYFINIPVNYTLYQNIYLLYQECLEEFYEGECYWYFYKISTKITIYHFVTIFIQAYQLSYIIKFERIRSKLQQVLFYFFILTNLQFIIFMIYLFSFQIEDLLIIPLYIRSLILLKQYFTTKVENIDKNGLKISKLFRRKILSILLLLLFFILIIFNYYVYKFFTFSYFNAKFMIKFTYLTIIIQWIFFLQWLLYNEILIKNQQIKFCNREELLTPNVRQFNQNCKKCQKGFQNGQAIIYFLDCQHFVHKECIIKWINYQCCQMDNNKQIEINMN